MSKPKMMVQMTAEEFERLVMNFGCPECHTHVHHHTRCTLGKMFEHLEENPQAKLMPKCPRCGFPEMIVYRPFVENPEKTG